MTVRLLLPQYMCECVFFREGTGTNHASTQAAAWPVCQAMIAHEKGRHSEAVDLLLPLRYDLHQLGGSKAQVGWGTH